MNKLILAAIAAPLLFGGIQTSALAACSGGSGADLSCAKVSDFQSYSVDWIDQNVAAATAYFQAVAATSLSASGTFTAITGYFAAGDAWGHNKNFNVPDPNSSGFNQQQKQFYTYDDAGSHSIEDSYSYSTPNIKFTVGTVASDAVTKVPYNQTASRGFSAQLSDLVKTVADGVVTYTATIDWYGSYSAIACNNTACTRQAQAQGSSQDSYQITLASFEVQAVPGPEAGAGLGAFALGGMALYMKRRRKEEPAAA